MDAPSYSSPSKRRVLGTLDANVSPRRCDAGKIEPQQQQIAKDGSGGDNGYPQNLLLVASVSPSCSPHHVTTAPSPISSRKRMSPSPEEESRKKQRLDASMNYTPPPRPTQLPDKHDLEKDAVRRSVSPVQLDVFDTSHLYNQDPAMNGTQGILVSEGGGAAVTAAGASVSASAATTAAYSTRREMGRGDTRRRAETLRLRLGLASYKIRTGQTDVPLDRLAVLKPPMGSLLLSRPRAHTAGALLAAIGNAAAVGQQRRVGGKDVGELGMLEGVSRVGSSGTSSYARSRPKSQPAGRAEVYYELATPRRASFNERELMRGLDSPAKAGAVNGLLSLARGRIQQI